MSTTDSIDRIVPLCTTSPPHRRRGGIYRGRDRRGGLLLLGHDHVQKEEDSIDNDNEASSSSYMILFEKEEDSIDNERRGGLDRAEIDKERGIDVSPDPPALVGARAEY